MFQKFLQHEELRNKLIETGNKRLVELNWWGDVWFGVHCITNKGKNFLGKILEKTRTYFIDNDTLMRQQMETKSSFIS